MTRPEPSPSRAVRPRAGLAGTLLLVLLAYVLSVTEYWHFAYAYASHFGDLYRYQRHLLDGHAEWLADQNRVLAPLLIAAFQRLSGVDYESAYQHVLFYSFIAFNIAAVMLYRLARLQPGEIAVGLLLAASVPLLLINYWWFPWTVLEAALLLVAFAADAARLAPASRVATIGLAFAALTLTKETAALLPIWLLFRHGTAALVRRRWPALLGWVALCAGMMAVSALVVAGLRHWLWVSGPDPDQPSGLPLGIPEFHGTHLLILAAGVLDYYRRGAVALASFRLPWSMGPTGPWPDWPAGFVDFVLVLALALAGTIWALLHEALDVLALTLTALVYLVVCFALVNMPESDKLMPEISIGLAVYALMCARRQQQASAAPPGGAGRA